MQEPNFERACRFPCQVLAMITEMEHRNKGTSYEDCMKTAEKVLAEEAERHKMLSDATLGMESVELELRLLGQIYGKEADGDEM